MNNGALLNSVLAIALSPFLLGVINRIKARFAGRCGQPLLQAYFDIWKLLHKGAVYSRTTTWVFRASPVVGLAAVLMVTLLIPSGGSDAFMCFDGDFLAAVYLLGLMRMFTVLGALDTGSSFEGMGTSREVQFSAIAEVAFLFGIAALAWKTGSLSISRILGGTSVELWKSSGTILGLVASAFMLVLLCENARIPVDDPNTHLELTMIHEVMVLDYSGPDLAMILYSSALKFWIFATLIVEIILPVHTDNPWMDRCIFVSGLMGVAILVGIIESSMARLKLLHVPRLLVGAGSLSFLALLLGLR